MRGPRPDYGQSDWASQGECEGVEPPYCPPEEECNAEMRNQDCTCDCNEEPPPKCDLDVVVMIDVCSCSPEVWHGIKSYVDALVTKYDQEIGVRTVIKVFSILLGWPRRLLGKMIQGSAEYFGESFVTQE